MKSEATENMALDSTTFFGAFMSQQRDSDYIYYRKERYEVSHSEVRYNGMPKAYSLAHQEWFSVLMLLEFLIYSFMLARYGHMWFARIKNFWRVKERGGLFWDDSQKDMQENVLCLMMTCINVGFFAYMYVSRGLVSYESQDVVVLFSLLISVLLFIVKILLVDFVGGVFFSSDVCTFVRSEILSLFSYLGLAMFGSVVVMAYSPQGQIYGLWMGVVAFVLHLLLKIYKLMSVFYAGIDSILYLFLYLCTLEILPLISLYLLLTIVAI